MTGGTDHSSQRGVELSSVEWLLDHHRMKEDERRRMVEDLGLRPGDLVLDSACGPGLWAGLLAEKVAPDGAVVALDFSADLLAHAGEARSGGGEARGSVELVLGDFWELPFPDKVFDVVFLGNCFCYTRDVADLLARQKRVTRDGGRVVSKEFDGATPIYHPVDPRLTLEVLAASARALEERAGASTFDNFVGRKMHGAFLATGFEEVCTRTYAVQKVAPLTQEAKRYITGSARWYGALAAPHLSAEQRRRWRAAFDPMSADYVLDRSDFYFCEVETLTVGVV